MNGSDGGADGRAVIQCQQVERTCLTITVDGDHHGRLACGTGLAWGQRCGLRLGLLPHGLCGGRLAGLGNVSRDECDHTVHIEAEATKLARGCQCLRRFHTADQTCTPFPGVSGVYVVQLARSILDHGLIDAFGLVGCAGLHVLAYAGHPQIRQDG